MKFILALSCMLPFVLGNHHLYPPNHCKLVHGQWGEWSSFGPCSKTCGTGGTQKRHRYCDSPIPKYGGRDCVGDEIEVKPCERYTACPVNGGYGDWHKGECSKKCGGGVVIYRRQCNTPQPQHCGKPCEGPHTRKEHCNTHHCKIPGGWTPWKCNRNCFPHKDLGDCVRNCTRTCTNPRPQYGGADCKGNPNGLKKCADDECHGTPPVHGPCYDCLLKAEKASFKNGNVGFVGHACRVDQSRCSGRKNGIRDMYPAKHWFFLHCSADGPWCKPCATRNLVYNPTCGQCETTRYGSCTGPGNWQKDEMELINDLEDEDNW